MLKNAQTYEIMRPEDVGLSRTTLVLGKHSGRHALRERVQKLGFQIDEAEFERVFTEFKALADRKKELFDGDIEALVLNAEGHEAGPWSLASLESAAASGVSSTAKLSLRHIDGHEVAANGSGDGPVDAAYKAVEDATGVQLKVTKYEVRALTVGEDAQGETVVYVTHGDRSYRGASISTNIVEASVNALLEVINRIELAQRTARSASSAERREAERLAQTAV